MFHRWDMDWTYIHPFLKKVGSRVVLHYFVPNMSMRWAPMPIYILSWKIFICINYSVYKDLLGTWIDGFATGIYEIIQLLLIKERKHPSLFIPAWISIGEIAYLLVYSGEMWTKRVKKGVCSVGRETLLGKKISLRLSSFSVNILAHILSPVLLRNV